MIQISLDYKVSMYEMNHHEYTLKNEGSKTSKTKSGCNMNKLILEDKLCYISNLNDKCFAFHKNNSINKSGLRE